MIAAGCASDGNVVCSDDPRRRAVRTGDALCGLDYVDVEEDGVTLCARIFGKVPANLGPQNVVIEGGERITGIRVTGAKLQQDVDGDTCLHVTVDRRGDFSLYCLCLVDPVVGATNCSFDALPVGPVVRAVPAGVDPRYACVTFGFRLDCSSDLDCALVPCPPSTSVPPPPIDYLARDFTTFQRLILDRLSVTMPGWTERHVADIGITLAELIAYRADQLSYQLDAVATEAYLSTARRRISVRRHARLLDYRLHEGCNARAWIVLGSDVDVDLPFADLLFAAPPPDAVGPGPGVVSASDLARASGALIFEPVLLPGTYRTVDGGAITSVVAAHSTIHFYTWRQQACCLPAGSVRATLLDQGAPGGGRILKLVAGCFVVFEEICGAVTGTPADRDPAKRHIVRLTAVEPVVDPLDGTMVLEIEWARCDALPFSLCLSARTQAPDCQLVEVAVVRGNVLLVDHGETVLEAGEGWIVGSAGTTRCCQCDGAVADVRSTADVLRFALDRGSISHAVRPVLPDCPTGSILDQDPRQAQALVALDAAAADPIASTSDPWPGTYGWTAVWDLLSSGPTDREFVAEIDDNGIAHVRFGDGTCGFQPGAGWRFRARYRVGNGAIGNAGADSLVWMARRTGVLSGGSLSARNPFAARGGIDPESTNEARLYAPHAYGRMLERAVTADDYATVALADGRIEGANAVLNWTGAWYEADIALDPYASKLDDTGEVAMVHARLARARRIGHDLRIVSALRVPLTIGLNVCVAAGYARSDVERAVLDALSTRVLADGSLGFFHPDRLVFGESIAASRVIAAVQALAGVTHVELSAFARTDADDVAGASSLLAGLITIGADEIAELENNRDFPERGTLTLGVRGGQ